MADKLAIATYFIMNSPPGEVRDVIHDVNKVMKDSNVLKTDSLTKILKEYNVKMLTSAKNPQDGTYCLTSQYGLVSDNEFVDPRSGAVLKFDYKTESWTPTGEQKVDDSPEKVAVQAAMDGYADQHYRENKCVPLVYSDGGALTICVAVRDLSLGNFWTGSWRGVYTLNVGSKGETTMKAAIDVIVHYYEDGNVQLRSHVEKETKVVVGSPDETGSSVAAAVKKIEHEFHEGLEKMYADMHTATFKSLRRFLPCTRQAMNWDVDVHTVNEDLAGTRKLF